MLGYLSADIIRSEKRTVFRERSSRKTVSFEEQIMFKGRYPSILSQPNWGYCVYYPSVLKIGEYPRIFPSFSWGIFAHVTRLDQSRVSENIWWVIITNISHLDSLWKRDWGELGNGLYYRNDKARKLLYSNRMDREMRSQRSVKPHSLKKRTVLQV